MNKAKSVIEYYVLNNKLKNIIRTGWKNWNVNRARLESVAEHIYGVQSLAIAMHSQYEYDLDLKKVLYMLAVHELEEIIIGDLTSWDISKEDKIELGHKAVSQLLTNLINKKEIEELVFEFDQRNSKEAIFAYNLDKVECDLQAKLYDEEECVNLNNQDNNPAYNDKIVQELLKSENGSWSKMWIEYDKSVRNIKDSNFIEVLDYAKNNKISL